MSNLRIQHVEIPGLEADYPIRMSLHRHEDTEARPMLIFCHGFKGFKDWGTFPLLASFFADAGFDFLRFNFSLGGTTRTSPQEIEDLEAFARNTIRRELEDLQQVIRYAKDTWHPKAIGLLGHSRGGGITLLGAAHDASIGAVGCLAPVHDFAERYPKEVLQHWEAKGVIHVKNGRNGMDLPVYWSTAEDYKAHKDLLDLPSLVPKMQAPICVVHGEADETLAVADAETLAGWNPRVQLLKLPETGHTFGGKHPWEEQHLPPALLEASSALREFFLHHLC
jgi:pimeloyl-ACP methyl ester carboxylesterase